MTSQSVLILKSWFSWGWQLLTSFYLPGTNVTPAAMLLFGSFAFIALKFFTRLVGNGSASDIGRVGSNINTRNNKGRNSKG